METNQGEHKIYSAYQKNQILRESLNELVQQVFKINFETWYQNGYWTNKYIPYSIIQDNTVLSNVSVNVMNFNVFGIEKTFIQIGTVATEKTNRGKGYSRYLMEHVINEWRPKSDLLFLFANDEVLNFYPKFGFKCFDEHRYSGVVQNFNDTITTDKIDMSNKANIDFVFSMVNNSTTTSAVDMRNNAELVMFHCMSHMKNNVYFVRELNALVIAKIKSDTIMLNAVYSSNNILLTEIINALSTKDTKRVVFGFTPNETSGFDMSLHKEEDTTLFMLSESHQFEENKFMFPIICHA
jgi:predicted acetyltransferase